MQQRTGVGEGGRRIRRTRDDIPVVYYVFDLLYLDGYNLMHGGTGATQGATGLHSDAGRPHSLLRPLRRKRQSAV